MSAPIRDKDRARDPLLYAPRRARVWAPSVPEAAVHMNDIAKLTTAPPMAPDAAGMVASPPMAPGIGGFNIDPPARRLVAFEGDVAVKELRRQLSLDPDVVPAPPIRLPDGQPAPWLARLAVVLLSAVAAFGLALVSFGGGHIQQSRMADRNTPAKALPRAETTAAESQSMPQARLIVASQRAFANEPLPLGVALNDASGGEMLTLAGLAAGTRLTAGTPRSATAWQVSARDLSTAFAYAPRDFVGVMDAVIDLRSAHERLMDSQIVRLEWLEKKPVTPFAVPGDPPVQPARVTTRDPEEIATLLKRGQDFLRSGDIAAARVVLRRAAEAGNAQAALALGTTFDAAVLAQLGVLGFAPDAAQARGWYQRAVALGSSEASRRLDGLVRAER